jgi:cytochrome P450
MSLQVYCFVTVALALIAAVRLYRYSKLFARPAKFPPGPRTVPFLGNLHQLPISRLESRFAEYAREFGAVTGLQLGRQSLVVLNMWQAVRDTVEQKGSIYSSRPSIPAAEIIVPGGLNAALAPYGSPWREQRSKISEFMGAERVERSKLVQDAESTQVMYDLLKDPEGFQRHIGRSFAAVILATVFGQRGKTYEPGGKIDRFFKTVDLFTAATSPTAAPPIASFPFLNNLPNWMSPWRGWTARASAAKHGQNLLYAELLSETKDRLTQSKGLDCFMSQCLKSQEEDWYNDTQLAYLGGILLEAGAETSTSSTLVFLLAMAAFPEVLKKAQEDVDRVCGLSRIPGKEDMPHLPYIRACMLEVLRWRPVAPMGIPHHTTAQDTYESYDIPAHSDVIINVWSINHDQSFYSSPASFDPSRYIENESGASPFAKSLDANKGRKVNYTFGAGRRVCPGQRFAENNLMMHFAKLVWTFNIEATGDLDVTSLEDWTDGLAVKPRDLKIRLQLRSAEKLGIVEQAWTNANAFLQQFE